MLTCQTVEPFRVGSFATEGPKNVGKMLFDQRYLGLHRKLDVAQISTWTTIGRHTREYPAAAFLVHQTARAVDRIDDDSPHDIRFSGPTRQNNLTTFQTLGDQQHWRNRRHFTFEEFDQHFFADAIEREDRIAFLLTH